jgi:hypothetical protein
MDSDPKTWKPGERALLDGGRRTVTIEEVGHERVRCSWFDGRDTRDAWIPVARLQCTSGTSDARMLTLY